MFFHKDSVVYKVPNHRLHELHIKWNMNKSGRRYKNASFLYTTTTVCKFCSQFFDVMPEEWKSTVPSLEDNDKLVLTTKLVRTDIARNQRAYQSSCVDGRAASLAISEPYKLAAKTKREVDPWWEVDYQRPYHIYSISFRAATGIKQKLLVHVMLLDKPYGFEDPFLDSVKGKSKLKKSFQLRSLDQSEMQEIRWELPEDTYCSVVRVQIEGIGILALQQFQAFQGDNMVEYSESDFLASTNTFAMLPPEAIRTGLFSMTSPEKRKEHIAMMTALNELIPRKREKLDEAKVTILQREIRSRYEQLEQWKQTVIDNVLSFTAKDINALFYIVFKHVMDMDPRNAPYALKHGTPLQAAIAAISAAETASSPIGGIGLAEGIPPQLPPDEISVPDSVQQQSASDGSTNPAATTQQHSHHHSIFHKSASTSPLMSSAMLLEHYPRCDLAEVHQRLRSVVRWIQTRTHLKVSFCMRGHIQ